MEKNFLVKIMFIQVTYLKIMEPHEALYICLIENSTLAFQEIVFIIFKNKTQQ